MSPSKRKNVRIDLVLVERRINENRVIVESIPCPFYQNGNCSVGGLMDMYAKWYFYKLEIYEKANDKLKKLERPLREVVLTPEVLKR